MKSKATAGYSLIELLMVISIMGVMASISAPRITLVLQRAYEGRAKAQLGAIRSALSMYHADTEGKIPFFNQPDGVASDRDMSLSTVITPTYIQNMPVPYLADPFNFPPGISYDAQAKINMAISPPRDIVFVTGAPTAILVSRPYVYNPMSGEIYYCNGNYSVAGEFYYLW